MISTTGAVWQTHGDIENNTFVWDEDWDLQEPPTPVATRAFRFKGDLRHAGVVNRG